MRLAMLGLACVLALSGCDSQSTDGGETHGGVESHLTLARSIALHEASTAEADITSASFVVRNGTVPRSNVGMPCTSGMLMDLKLIGHFPHYVTTGHPVAPGEHEDFTVTAVILTADPATGEVCRRGVQTGDVEPEPGAVDIPVG
jgi:hypothetical protein